MISICIPVYNFDVRPLVQDLCKQIEAISTFEIDIILIDDASEESFRKINHIEQINVQYIQLEQNIGRSKIRNLFLKHTSQPYLLFLDGDSSVAQNAQFVQNYIQAVQANDPDVVCGGRVYPEKCPSPAQSLSWNYGVKIESQTFQERQNNTSYGFQSNNFLIKRTVFQSILFEEALKQYGHEDTLFGIALYQQNIKILHIDNPILNDDIELNKNFIHKNALAAQNLAFLVQSNKITASSFGQIKLLSFYQKLQSLGLTSWFMVLFEPFKNKVLKNLESEKPNLKLFNMYKLFLFIKEKRCLEEGSN